MKHRCVQWQKKYLNVIDGWIDSQDVNWCMCDEMTGCVPLWNSTGVAIEMSVFASMPKSEGEIIAVCMSNALCECPKMSSSW